MLHLLARLQCFLDEISNISARSWTAGRDLGCLAKISDDWARSRISRQDRGCRGMKLKISARLPGSRQDLGKIFTREAVVHKLQSNPVDTDTDGTMKTVHINGVSMF